MNKIYFWYTSFENIDLYLYGEISITLIIGVGVHKLIVFNNFKWQNHIFQNDFQ